MDQKITAPDDEWIKYIAQMWLLGNQISREEIGEEMDEGLGDLDRLQKILDANCLAPEETQALQALGIVFGTVFVNEMPGYDWWVVEDEYGKDACVRYKETTLLAFPQTMISKRIEDGEEVDVQELFTGLQETLESVRQENYSE